MKDISMTSTIERIQSSFDDQRYYNCNALVLVPHEDDEILVAGNIIQHLIKNGANVYVAYSTNGDYFVPSDVRIKEAVEACGELGVGASNIFFLGYGDNLNNSLKDHIFYHHMEPVKSNAGKTRTYGGFGYDEFVYHQYGYHHSYCAKSFEEDLESLLEVVLPQLIICVDFDEHSDHRMLSLFFDRTLATVRRKRKEYMPQVFKRFAYPLAYFAVDDFRASNINALSTQFPDESLKKNSFCLVNKLFYNWDERVRIPAQDTNIISLLRNNKIYKAVKHHKSQNLLSRLGSILNSDEVFWEKKNNIAINAQVSTSSGEGHFLNDGLYFWAEDIDRANPVLLEYAWRPTENDKEKRIELKWDDVQEISYILLYGTVTQDDNMCSIGVECNGTEMKFDLMLSACGQPAVIELPTTYRTDRVSVFFLSYRSLPQVSELEVITRKANNPISPYIKICTNQCFVDQYYFRDEPLIMETYIYGIDAQPKYQIVRGEGIIQDKRLIPSPDCKELIVRATINTEEGDIYDETVFRRMRLKYSVATTIVCSLIRISVICSKVCYKTKQYKRAMRKNGIIPFVIGVSKRLLGKSP